MFSFLVQKSEHLENLMKKIIKIFLVWVKIVFQFLLDGVGVHEPKRCSKLCKNIG